MLKVLLCVGTQHDWRLVALAAAVCLAATLATFFLYAKTPPCPAWVRGAWLGMTGVTAGSGIWTTHFVGMLAFRTGLETGYAIAPTAGSLILAIASTTLGFAIAAPATGRSQAWRTLLGGLVVGVGITGMHYLGMQGYMTMGRLQWDGGYVAASVAIGAVLAAAALYVTRGANDRRSLSAASGLLTLAIVGMHFTGMTAVTVVPDASIVPPASLMSTATMVGASVGVTLLILIMAVGGVAFDTANRNGALKRLREALDVMPEGLAFYDAADRLVAWNTRYEDLCGMDGAQLAVGMPFSALLETKIIHRACPAAIGRETEWIEERRAARRGQIPDLIQQTAAGRWLRITERRTSDGGTVSVSVDVTDMKRTQDAMAEARDRAEELARRAEAAEAVAGLGHWRMEAGSLKLTWSMQMYRIYGFDETQPLDVAAVMSMTLQEDSEATESRLERQFSGLADNEGFPLRFVREGGDVRHLACKSCVERSASGEIVAVIGTAVDVTDQKALETQLRLAHADAEAASAVKAEFLANMSHELRTPLTSIIGFTNLAAEQAELGDLARNYVSRVKEASRALLCTVNDILDFSKLEAGQVAIHPQPVSLTRLAAGTLELFTPQAGAKDLDLILDGDAAEGDLIVALDPDRIRQILLNLVGNAVKFTAAGSVTLAPRYDASRSRLRIEVIDTGDGIAKDKQDILFKRFSQVDGSRTRTQGGTGLGLAICKGLIEAMGGEIGVDSRDGEGSHFWFEVPAPRAVLPSSGPDEEQIDRPAYPGVRVLVVDDHATNRQLASLFLAGVGAEVSEAVDGEDAVRIAAELPFDLILMDIRMPRLDGPGALQRIRSSEGPNDVTPILAFTADATPDLVERLTALGFQDVVSKPIDGQALISAVARATAFADDSAETWSNVG